MKKRWILVSLVVGVAGALVYFAFRAPPGMEPMGETEENIALLGAIAGIAGALSAILGVVKEIISLIRESRSKT